MTNTHYVSDITNQWLQTNLFYMFLVVFACVVFPLNPFCLPILIVVIVTNLVFVLKFIKSVYCDSTDRCNDNPPPSKDVSNKKFMGKIINTINTRTGEEFELIFSKSKNFSFRNISLDEYDEGVFSNLDDGSIKCFGEKDNYQFKFPNVIKKDGKVTQFILTDKKHIDCYEKYNGLSLEFVKCFLEEKFKHLIKDITSVFDFIEQLFNTFINLFRTTQKDVIRATYHRITDVRKLKDVTNINYTGLDRSYNYTTPSATTSTTPAITTSTTAS